MILGARKKDSDKRTLKRIKSSKAVEVKMWQF